MHSTRRGKPRRIRPIAYTDTLCGHDVYSGSCIRAIAGIEEGKARGARSDAEAPRSGSRSHVARTVIRYGTTDVVVLTKLVEAIAHEKAEEAKEGELRDQSRIRLGICAMAPAVGEQDHVASLA